MVNETSASSPAASPAAATSAPSVPSAPAATPDLVTKIIQGKVGQVGQPTIAEWDQEILADIRVALGKIDQSPKSKYTHLARVIRANLR